ncbi:hypothetical protein LQ757_13595 [Agromyces sp. SYSU K20354]|uniref:hypothetical protein n=1 Tax=Agromyces cavernae TaxID=2898659 RepID=UPI001E3C05A4|nr:hypothetical protein [Agromyces cavernae]MCD2443311.1 hypothetical protein [Agromyces cavernae]
MKTHPRRPVLVGIALALLLAFGAGVAFVIGDELGIRSEPADLPTETPTALPETAAVAPPAFTDIAAPVSARLDLAVGELQAAISEAEATEGTTTLEIVAGDGPADDESYRLEGEASALRIVAAGEAGAARGVYDLAAAVRDRRSVTEHLGETVESRLGFRMVDLGAVGVTVDEAEWAAGDDYSHNSKAFADVILPEAPYIDDAALEVARADFETYVQHVLAEGYNAIAIPGFIEYLTFEGVGDGEDVYGPDDTHVARAEAMRAAFGPMWEYAHDLGLKVYFRTDMLALTTPLERYLEQRFGSLDTENPEFWDVYAAGLDELYEAMPYLDGLLIRIGEAGRVYDLPGWDYYSALAVTSVDGVRAMLTAFTEQAERADREVIFRSWSVGVGAVGDMHTNADSYHAVLDGIDSDRLIVSTKYTLGDFYSHLPFNDTLEVGHQRRIVEFQSRREFENFGAFPNDLGVLYQEALQRFIAANPNVEGIWTWTQDGGPWRAGPLSLELKAGFWQLYELNTELAVRLARDPDADPAAITADWARRWFSDDPATVQAIGKAMAQSREAITDGLYIGPFADRRVFAIGLEPPPMMWIFEWDIVTGDSAVLDVIYEISRDDLDEAIVGGDRALAAVERMRASIEATDAATWRDPELRTAFLDTLDYQASTYDMLGDYRAMFLRQAQWHDTRDPAAHEQWDAARRAFEASAAAHEAAYAGDPYYPAYNLTAAELGVERAERDLPMAWAARIALVLLAAWLVYGILAGRSGSRRRGAGAARALWVAGTRPWRAAEVTERLGPLDRVLVVAVPAVLLVGSRGIQTWFLAPAHLLVALGSWLVFVLVVLLALRLIGRRPAWPVLAAIGGAATLRVGLLLAVLTATGPGGYWFAFWTDPFARSLYVTVAFAAFGWVIVAAAWALATQIGGRRAAGVVIAGVGIVLATFGALIGVIGVEAALTAWNDQMALVPWGLSRILGIAVYLDVPADAAWYAAVAGAVLALAGTALALPRKRR